MRSVEELNAALEPARVAIRGLIRRMTVTLTGTAAAAKAIWQVAGVKMLDGEIEAFNAEVFTGIGFYARPPATGKPEAIVLMVGADNELPVVVGVRDEKTRAAIAGAFKANETGAFNTLAVLHITANGTIEARTAAGVAVPLALKSDVQALADWAEDHTHPGNGSPPDPPAPPSPNGTTCLKGH